MNCANCGHERFWEFTDRVTCQSCGAIQWRIKLLEKESHNCGACSKPLSGRKSKKYCNAQCRQRAHRRENRNHWWRRCLYCKSEFQAKRPASYCSGACKQADYRARKQGNKFEVVNVPFIEVPE